MIIEAVKKLPPLERFLYWIKERHNIYLRRQAGQPKPWTDDEVLQTVFFTNPYRENDKVTVWFRKHIRDPLKDDPRVIFATAAFRWFNLPETAMILQGGDHLKSWDASWKRNNLLLEWDYDQALLRLKAVRNIGCKIFTGAYMINSPAGEPKLEAIVRRVTNVWNSRHDLMVYPPRGWPTMEELHKTLTVFDGMGSFMSYEVVCDLRYTYVLRDAPDKLTWCNPGPGCVRGLYRLEGKDWPSKGNNATSPPRPKDWRLTMLNLLNTCRTRLSKYWTPFEMREVEHSLCEWDKYERVLWGDGRPKRIYEGTP